MSGFEVAMVLGLLVVAALYARAPHRSLFYAGLSFARRYRLLIDDEFAAAVMRAERRERRAHAAVLAVIALVLTFVLRAPGSDFLAVLSVTGAVAVAARFVVRFAAAGKEFPVAPGRPSVARVRVVRPSDLVHPVEWGCFVIWGAGALGATAIGVHRHDATAAVTGAVLALTVTAAAAFVIAWCRRPEPAADAAHLFLQDAWRVRCIQQTVAELATVSFVLAQVTWERLGGPESGGWSYLPVAFGLVPLLGAGVGKNRFRERLWPDLPAGQVVAVGATP